MYAVVPTANSRWAAVIVGAAQNTVNQPTYSGCRNGQGATNRSDVYGTPRNASHTCRRPNRSKWLMRNVVASTTSQPAAYAANTAARAASPGTSQTIPPSGCHCQNSTKSAALDRSTYVLRSAGSGTNRVSQRLNPGRAIPLCCTANSASSPTSITKAAVSDPWRGPSNWVGVRNPPMNPTE